MNRQKMSSCLIDLSLFFIDSFTFQVEYQKVNTTLQYTNYTISWALSDRLKYVGGSVGAEGMRLSAFSSL